ncbi:MAG: hypothetical protein NTV70_17175 [Acidobacteria bacterium]|nr:hypothetical protein [Acidobacteriota bacterium]
MKVDRRLFVGSLMLSGGSGVASPQQPAAPDLESLRVVSAAHGVRLTDERLLVLKPVLESRQGQLRVLRDLTVGDEVAPTAGIPGGDLASETH